ncbi:hypothetical protein RJ641_028304 [Dillenia turbinata]|uniref:Uncharacterized protein n=1 Tax=Dillenia turbinata TaxID=194707 RepID=A0AAN8WBP9_9MAGN
MGYMLSLGSFWLLQMDICSPRVDSVTGDMNSFRGLKPPAQSPIRNSLVNELGNSFTKLKVDIEDGQESSLKSSPSSEDGYYTFEEPPSKLVSAIKGSREKEGLPVKKMSVSWASDVYDPPPSDFSHVGKIKNQRPYKNLKENKKNGKGKQKGKAAKGAGTKDKKQLRRLAGKAKASLDSTEDPAGLFYRDYSMPPVEPSDSSDLGSPDSCGDGFLKTPFSKYNYWVNIEDLKTTMVTSKKFAVVVKP